MTVLDFHRSENTESYLLDSTSNNLNSESDQDTESLASLETDDGHDHPPEKIIAEGISYSGFLRYLIKWKDCDILRSSWEKVEFLDTHPRLLEEWIQEKEKIERGERKPFDIDDFNNQVLEVEKREKERRILRSLSSFAEDTNIVCSSTDATDCYPRIFQATKDFQDIREGQEIPPGLHVRLNIYDGKREARLNIPMEGENGEVHNSDEIPTQNSIIAIPTPEKEELIEEPVPRKNDQKPPAYKSEGKVPMPNPTDAETFQSSLQTIKEDNQSIDQALENLSDLSHDIYFGMEIIKDASALQKLVCMAFWFESKNNSISNKMRGRKAAIIIGSALHNNPGAMKELEPKKNIVMYPICAAKSEATKDINGENFVIFFGRSLKQEQDPIILKTKIVTLSRLLKEPSIRGIFLEEEGMKLLLSIFASDNDGFNIVRKKISELVMDNFLDEESGADISIWPKSRRSPKTVCMNKENNLEDGCWEHHIEKFSSISPKEKWLKEFLLALKDQRSKKKTKTEL